VVRATPRQISFADVELMRQGVRLEPLLEVISKFLGSQHEMIERVRRDLVRSLKKPRKSRRALTAPQVLRPLILMCVRNWDHRELGIVGMMLVLSAIAAEGALPRQMRPPKRYSACNE
jgi:transposase, IS5 family